MERRKVILGWVGVAITVIIAGFWAYWGAFENFHEGWYSTSVWQNMSMFLFQYLILAIVFVALALIILKWKKIGLVLHLLLGGFSIYFFSGANLVLRLLIIIPFALLGLLYFFGEPRPKKWAYRLIIFIPLIIAVSISVHQGIKVAQRVNDQDFGIRVVQGRETVLAWAPRGPGWPDKGVSWEEAQEICRHLSADGQTIMEEEQNIWRLPAVEEAVHSMMIHGENAGGVWDPATEKATYDRNPDKETPLWDIHSKVIYYWTADNSLTDDSKAYIIVYNGGVFPRAKTNSQDYLSFRAVKKVSAP